MPYYLRLTTYTPPTSLYPISCHLILQELFLSITEYQDLFKPKAHWYSHFPTDIMQFGTTRQYWCMRFEALNQFFKRVATHGSYRDTLYRYPTLVAPARALAAASRVLAALGADPAPSHPTPPHAPPHKLQPAVA